MDNIENGQRNPRKVYLFMMTSLDGYFEGPNHELDWHNVDKEFDEFTIEQLNQVGVILFGRRTYEMMASFWPSKYAKETDPIVAGLMNSLPKIVFSRTLDRADWTNTRLVKTGLAEEVASLKGQPGKDIAVFGSSNLCVSLANLDLIDEFRIMINPVILGEGHPLLGGLGRSLRLKTKGERRFRSGNVLIHYVPDISPDVPRRGRQTS